MEYISPAVMSEIAERLEAPGSPPPEEWDTTPLQIYIADDNSLVFKTVDRLDAERTLYAMMRVIGGF